MLDIGGWEFLIVAFVLIMVVGPKELPKMLRSFTRIIRQVRSMASEFSRGMQTMADEAELGVQRCLTFEIALAFWEHHVFGVRLDGCVDLLRRELERLGLWVVDLQPTAAKEQLLLR